MDIDMSMYIDTSLVGLCVGENGNSLMTPLKSLLPCFLQSRDSCGAVRSAVSALRHRGIGAFNEGEILQSSSLEGKKPVFTISFFSLHISCAQQIEEKSSLTMVFLGPALCFWYTCREKLRWPPVSCSKSWTPSVEGRKGRKEMDYISL